MIGVMLRHAFPLAASAVADVPKAAVPFFPLFPFFSFLPFLPFFPAAADGARG